MAQPLTPDAFEVWESMFPPRYSRKRTRTDPPAAPNPKRTRRARPLPAISPTLTLPYTVTLVWTTHARDARGQLRVVSTRNQVLGRDLSQGPALRDALDEAQLILAADAKEAWRDSMCIGQLHLTTAPLDIDRV
jgi:hypothetical protein